MKNVFVQTYQKKGINIADRLENKNYIFTEKN